MLREMSSSQFAEWMAFYQQWSPEADDDFRFGVVAASIYNTAPRDKGNRKVYQPKDFFPSRIPEPEKKSPQQLLDKLVGINQQLGGRDRRRR